MPDGNEGGGGEKKFVGVGGRVMKAPKAVHDDGVVSSEWKTEVNGSLCRQCFPLRYCKRSHTNWEH